MQPETIAVILSILASAIATAILRWSAYHWPTGYHIKGAVKSNGVTPKEEEKT